MAQEELDAESITGDDAHSGDEPTSDDVRIQEDNDGIQDEKTTMARVKPSTKTLVNDMKIGDESFDDIVRRIFGVYNDMTSDVEHLQKRVDDLSSELEADRQLADKQVDDYIQRIEALELKLHDKQTAIVPADGQASLDSFGSLGMKDIAEEIREGCGGDETCTSTVVKLQQTRIEAMSKHLDRDHDAEQKGLDRDHVATQKAKDREEKEKDRALKKSMADDERQLKKELSYIKKGYIPKGDLDDLVDIGRIQPKNAKKSLGYAKKQANAEADEEETPARSGLTEGEMDEEEWNE